MTGFGKAELNENGTTVTVEIHSVNGRYLDMKLKLPRQLYEYESDLRKIGQKYIKRGRVSLTVYVDKAGSRIENMAVDYDLAERYMALSEEMADRFGIKSGLDSRAVMLLPNVMNFDEPSGVDDDIWNIVRKGADAAFSSHRKMREQEGESIGADVSGRLTVIRGFIEQIKTMAPAVVEQNTIRLREKIQTLLDTTDLDENRFAMEVALYANRVDITEECVRFTSHCDLFEKETSSNNTSGKKLSFLLQELNREANTITSKVQDADISHIVVQIKEELEKMREQVENME